MTQDDNRWPFPAVSLYRMKNAAGDQVWSLSGLDAPAAESYLSRFGVIPANEGAGGPRKLVRPGPGGEWIVMTPDGASPLESAPQPVCGREEVRACLIAHTWYSVGFTVNPTLIEFSFAPDGEGFSRYMESGFQSKVPIILDAYWRYAVEDGRLHITWDEGPADDIPFELHRRLRAASGMRNGALMFYEAVLIVDRHLFPPGSGFQDGWPKDYWGLKNPVSEGDVR